MASIRTRWSSTRRSPCRLLPCRHLRSGGPSCRLSGCIGAHVDRLVPRARRLAARGGRHEQERAWPACAGLRHSRLARQCRNSSDGFGPAIPISEGPGSLRVGGTRIRPAARRPRIDSRPSHRSVWKPPEVVVAPPTEPERHAIVSSRMLDRHLIQIEWSASLIPNGRGWDTEVRIAVTSTAPPAAVPLLVRQIFVGGGPPMPRQRRLENIGSSIVTSIVNWHDGELGFPTTLGS